MIKLHGYNPAELERFHHYQSLSYNILDATAQSLQIRMSEHQATRAVNLGNSAVFEELDQHLPVLRDLIRNRINESGTFQKIAWEVDDFGIGQMMPVL